MLPALQIQNFSFRPFLGGPIFRSLHNRATEMVRSYQACKCRLNGYFEIPIVRLVIDACGFRIFGTRPRAFIFENFMWLPRSIETSGAGTAMVLS